MNYHYIFWLDLKFTASKFYNYISLLAIVAIITTDAERLVDMHRRGCGETKGCLFKPAGCDPLLDCTIGMIFYVSAPNMLTIQLVGQTLLPTPHYQYIAIGFSKDDLMGDDYVSECVLSPSVSTFGDVEVFASYNYGKSNDRTYLNATEHEILYRDVRGEVVDGRLMCQFTQQIVPQIRNKNGVIWNLNQKLYIIGATGSAQPDEINAHDTTTGSHFFPIITARRVNPSLVGPKIYELSTPFLEQNASQNETKSNISNKTQTSTDQIQLNHSTKVENSAYLPHYSSFLAVIIIVASLTLCRL